ncbi:cytochrome c [Azohydromonas lata]|uniref:cytochrome c n=1 Tax=Azohydromonas lata TaxID=45677 RepID=UPI000834F153|nr:cytochrome c [Azohydromonas lata]
MSARLSKLLRGAAVAVVALALLAALVAWLNVRGEAPLNATAGESAPADPEAIVRGAYLARAGNCMGCHTARGGEPYAGGRPLETPFGTVVAPNLTPDRDTGLGAWTAGEFWRALHNGRSRDGRLLYPAFPYPNYTLVTREDSDALFAYLQTLAPVARRNDAHALRFPYKLQASLAVWRALYFRPARLEPDPAKTAQWNRGSYLVQGLGHCVACHAPRNWMGATESAQALGGGLIPMQNWYAPPLAPGHGEAGAAPWSVDEIAQLLGTGFTLRGAAMGPMAEVVYGSTQHLGDADLRAMAVYLQSLPAASDAEAPAERAGAQTLKLGGKLYGDHCAACHGDAGQGAPGAYPALAGNRAATMASPNNLVKALLHGGFPPATQGNPRPYGMPPFKQLLSERDIAAVATYVRQSWGNQGSTVSELDVLRAR